MLTITVKVETFGLGMRAAGDVYSALGYLGRVMVRSDSTVLFQYDHTKHEAVCGLLAPWAGWVKAVVLEKVEADLGYGESTVNINRK